jgi:photosystem II stability/assembly factor-like uncharacterized protein
LTSQPEDVLVYYDDMQNDQFDAMIASGSGSYSVTDTGGGNQAAWLSGAMELKMRSVAWASFTWEDYETHLRVKRSSLGTVAFGFRWILFLPHAPLDSDRGYWLENTGDQWSLVREVQGVTTTLQTVTNVSPVNEWYHLNISVHTIPEGAQVEAFINGELILSHTDPTPIPFGGMAFRSQGAEAELWLDDCEIIEHVDRRYTWSQTGGPQGADWVSTFAVDPLDWRVAYFGGSDAGLFKTTDGGVTWVEIGLANGLYTPRIKTIELAPANHEVIYAGAGGKHVGTLWRSDDGGGSWKWTATADMDTEAETPGIAVDRADPMHIYFSMSIAAVGPGPIPGIDYGLYESMDGGETVNYLTGLGDPIGPVEINPGNPEHILAGSLDAGSSGVSIIGSVDGGDNWSSSDSGISGDDIGQILFYDPDPTYVFAVTTDQELNRIVYRSTDGGSTWSLLSSIQSANFLGYSPQVTPMLIAHGPNGMFGSIDKGDTWEAIADPSCEGGPFGVGTDEPSVIYSSISPDIAVSTDLGQTCATSLDGLLALPVSGFGVAPSDADTVYAATVSSLHKSTNGGETWEFMRMGQFPGIAVDPVDSNTVYIGAAEFALVLKSTDGGATWTDITGPITFPGVSTLTIDPQDRMTVYAGTGHGPQMGPGGEGLFKSTNGGQSWSKVQAIPDVAVPSVIVHPTDSNRVVVGTARNGVYVSDDGGGSFEQRNNGFLAGTPGPTVWALAVHPSNPEVMYAGTNAFYGRTDPAPNANNDDRHGHVHIPPDRPVDEAPDALYKTTDGGLNWTLLLAGEGVQGRSHPFLYFGCCVDAIAINPVRPEEVYVALHDPGVLFSEDGGQNWRYVNHGLVPLLTHLYPYRITISTGGEVLYTTTCGRSVFRNNLRGPEIPFTIYLPSVVK